MPEDEACNADWEALYADRTPFEAGVAVARLLQQDLADGADCDPDESLEDMLLSYARSRDEIRAQDPDSPQVAFLDGYLSCWD